MKSKLITVIPVYNGEGLIERALKSIAAQTLRPDRVVVLDNCSTDKTEEVVKGFKPIQCEWRRHETNLGWATNFTRGLEYAEQTEYLQLLCADDAIKPNFYERMIAELESCEGRGLAYCLDERIDEHDQRLSVSGKATGEVEILTVSDFLKQKAELGNQAIASSLLKTAGQKSPCEFRLDFPIVADTVFWADWGRQSKKIVFIHEALGLYRWHGTNNTHNFSPQIQPLVLDEWRAMQMLEQWRGAAPNAIRQFKLKGLFAVRSGIKAKRLRGQHNIDYSNQVVAAAKKISGPLAWTMAQVVVEARDLLVYKIMGRPMHPKNIYG
ncbi:MAG: glycosyltransferase family 2 protein [Methylacidiphilales bacterium]|nr:glycosyltransferase family 2 protein [Candidatus Methylacidiphilales bacterium]